MPTPDARRAALARLDPAALALLKDLTSSASSPREIGATQVLAYERPGGYRGCMELGPGQKAWATGIGN